MNEKLKRDLDVIDSLSADLRSRQNAAAAAEKRRNQPEPPPPPPISDKTAAAFIKQAKQNGLDLEAIARQAAQEKAEKEESDS